MQQTISFLTFDDVKRAVSEVLTEHQAKTPPKTTEPEAYIYGLEALSKHLGIGVTTAWKLKKSGKLPFYQSGKKLFFKKSEIETVLASRIW